MNITHDRGETTEYLKFYLIKKGGCMILIYPNSIRFSSSNLILLLQHVISFGVDAFNIGIVHQLGDWFTFIAIHPILSPYGIIIFEMILLCIWGADVGWLLFWIPSPSDRGGALSNACFML